MENDISMNSVSTVNVIGGGTAGWISAAILAKSFIDTGRDIQVRVIESANIPTIGVGEGTFPTIVSTLHFLGISEREFLACCDGSFKQGAQFRNWLYDPAEKQHAYYHPFDPPAKPKSIDLASYWIRDHEKLKMQKDFAEAVTVQANLCDNNLAPKDLETAEYNWMARYAYHLDAGKFGQLLQRHATQRLGVKHTYADVVDVTLDDEGYIKNVVADDGAVFKADFFVDCTGFRSLLLGKALNVPFVDKSKYLNVNSAVTRFVPYQSDEQAVATHTISTAQDAGWIWDIALQSRRGTGYVYSSDHIDPQEAERVLKRYCGVEDCEQELKHLSFKVGYREKFWHKNCAGIGLSSGFVEPLEATAIAMVEAGARSLAARFPANRDAMETMQKQYNRVFTLRWDNIIDFVKLHYCLTKRKDTQFWRQQTSPETIPASLQEKLAAWKHYAPSDADFSDKYEIFGIASWQYILYGMEYKSDYVECGIIPREILSKAFASVQLMAQDANSKLMTNREFLREYQKPFSK